MKFILSDESINSYGCRVLTSGIMLDDFRKNPVMFYNHNRMNLPIGKWKNIAVENGKLVAEPDFDPNDELALQVADKVSQGILNACSIGIDAITMSDDPKDLEKGQTRPTIIKSRIFEASIVDIPSNANALKLCFESDKGIVLSGAIPQELLNRQLPILKSTSMKEIALSLGLPENATEQEILAKINSNKALALSKEGNTEAGIKALLALAEPKGLKKETVEKLAKADFDATVEMVLSFQAPETTARDAEGKTSEERLSHLLSAALEGAAGKSGDERKDWTLSDWEKKDSKGLKEIIKNDHKKYQKLFKDAHGVELSLDDIKSIRL